MNENQAPKALYIHIPFCTNKCHYCDFTSYVLKGQPVDQYLDALEQEMIRTVEILPPTIIETVFVGGGTPTVLTPPQMERFLKSVRDHFPIATDAEFTMEANPGTTDIDKLQAMRDGGVNRISFGVQSFDNGLLEKIGRIHNVDDVYRSIENARKVGFDNLSIDLMFGLPGQTLTHLSDSVDRAMELGLPHYSIYSLKVEENTLFHKLYERNELPLPPEEEEFNMFLLLMEKLEKNGYAHYEISNFAKPGFEGRHNSTYWRNESYYGLGAGAHGYSNRTRHINLKGINPYIEASKEKLPRLETFEVPEQEAMEDFMMVGLRLREGVKASNFAKQFPGHELDVFFGSVIEKLFANGLLERVEVHADTIYRLTNQGVLLGNEVFGAFIGLER
ncbi:oxygen-independent coproporphyrinogen III oxidase [Paenibacillus sp. GSMTC-2017]|uniref:radical SAM family heme chaperone HemW n=1 Tax=Paenibacillus sp. GSMTC-2017 TaxID=2794350 RepID=UPI0018D8AC2B|nr:radical SAM family heme chaperone HemW [Paenibacillus sp. GSMTC-2017]MBH5318156.1 oxygen-independent coproporphyrinogen III oxidase [Paenibacillus sp. GSMTC-2017]